MCTQYGACLNLPLVTASDGTGVLTAMGLEGVSKSEKVHIVVYVHTIWCMFKLTASYC